MGKQITFFMLNEDEMEFINLVNQFGDIIADNKGNIYLTEEVVNSDKRMYFILSLHSNIIYDSNGFIDVLRSDVIQFSRSMVRKEKKVEYGRLWVELRYYNEAEGIVTKEKWLDEKYNSYRKWIKKHYKISKDKYFYIGNGTYNLYKNESYKLMATPLLEVEFEGCQGDGS